MLLASCWILAWLALLSWIWCRYVPLKRRLILPDSMVLYLFVFNVVRISNPTPSLFSGHNLKKYYVITKTVITMVALNLWVCRNDRQPLWSSDPSSWLRIQRSRIWFRCYLIFWEVVKFACGLNPRSL
jgi:hypothetical protein